MDINLNNVQTSIENIHPSDATYDTRVTVSILRQIGYAIVLGARTLERIAIALEANNKKDK